MKIAVLAGDGIGPEIVDAAESILDVLDRRFALGLSWARCPVGMAAFRDGGSTFPDSTRASVQAADGIVLGPLSTSDYPPPGEGGINVSAWLRQELDLFANIRPSRSRLGVPAANPNLDIVIVRENTEGFYASRAMHAGAGEFAATPDIAFAVRKISSSCSARIAAVAFEISGLRPGRRVTAVHKRNVLPITEGVFLDECRKMALAHPDISYDEELVDSVASRLVRRDAGFDVLLTTNLFGDILSNEAAELAGGLGLSASINIGASHVMAQASHGSAPDLAGRNLANPVSMIGSVSLLLNHLGHKHRRPNLLAAALALDRAVDHVLEVSAIRTIDLGGSASTSEVAMAVQRRLLIDEG